MNRNKIMKSFFCILIITLLCSTLAIAGNEEPMLKLVETENKDQYKVQIHNWVKEASSVQFDVVVDQKVEDYSMEWADKASSSYTKIFVKKGLKNTTFTFCVDRLSPISNEDIAQLGMLTIEDMDEIPKFSTSGKMKVLNESLKKTSFDNVRIEAEYNDDNHVEKPTEAPPTEAPPTEAPPTEAPPTEAPPTEAPPTEAPPTEAPPTESQPTEKPTLPTEKPTPPTVETTPTTEEITEKPSEVKKFMSLNMRSITLYRKGNPKSFTLTASISNKKQSGSSVKWKTSNKNVVTVKNGKVTAVDNGSATIEAKKDNLSAKCKVKVKNPTISMNKEVAVIYTKGSTSTILKAKVNGAEVSGTKVKWTSSDPKTAVVKDGKVTAKKNGLVTITAAANGKTAKCIVKVWKPSLKLKTESFTIKKGKTAIIKAVAKPKKPITYKSSNKKIATVSENGEIVGVEKGNTTITVLCNGLKKEVKVRVK